MDVIPAASKSFPLNRGFEYGPFAKDGTYRRFEELW